MHQLAASLPNAADIVVECLPPSAFGELAEAMLARPGSTLVTASVGRLLTETDFPDRARAASLRIVAPSGAIAGLDGLHAAREAGLEAVSLKTRKPPQSFDGKSIPTDELKEPVRLFSGNAAQSVAAFPKNINVAATVALAGLGGAATQVEIWADPGVTMNTHELFIRSKAGSISVRSENLPDETNPKSSMITAYSILAVLRRMDAALTIGS